MSLPPKVLLIRETVQHYRQVNFFYFTVEICKRFHLNWRKRNICYVLRKRNSDLNTFYFRTQYMGYLIECTEIWIHWIEHRSWININLSCNISHPLCNLFLKSLTNIFYERRSLLYLLYSRFHWFVYEVIDQKLCSYITCRTLVDME